MIEPVLLVEDARFFTMALNPTFAFVVNENHKIKLLVQLVSVKCKINVLKLPK